MRFVLVLFAGLAVPVEADASALYPLWLQDVIQGVAGTSLAGEVDCVLIDGTHYTYSAVHRTSSDIPSLAREGTPLPLLSKSFTNGKFSANSLTFGPVPPGNPATGLACWTNVGSESTNRLVVFLDGINQTPIGGTITINFDPAYGLFTL